MRYPGLTTKRRTSSRPKWARCLSALQWKELRACFAPGRPTLHGLRDNVAYQRKNGIYCWACATSLRTVDEAREAADGR